MRAYAQSPTLSSRRRRRRTGCVAATCNLLKTECRLALLQLAASDPPQPKVPAAVIRTQAPPPHPASASAPNERGTVPCLVEERRRPPPIPVARRQQQDLRRNLSRRAQRARVARIQRSTSPSKARAFRALHGGLLDTTARRRRKRGASWRLGLCISNTRTATGTSGTPYRTARTSR